MTNAAESATPEDPHLRDLLLNVGATFFVAASATMLTDFSRRLLGSDLDSLGAASIAVQASFVLAASSTFTDGGWATICTLIKRRIHHDPDQALWRFWLALLLLAVTTPAWLFGPRELAKYYGWAGYRALSPSSPSIPPKPDVALKDFQRALALDSSLPHTSTDMGGTFEAYYRYDDAVSAYQAAIALDPTDLVAYNNLDVLDGKLIATPDTNPSHLSPTAPTLRIGTAKPVPVVISAAAQQLIREHEIHKQP